MTVLIILMVITGAGTNVTMTPVAERQGMRGEQERAAKLGNGECPARRECEDSECIISPYAAGGGQRAALIQMGCASEEYGC